MDKKLKLQAIEDMIRLGSELSKRKAASDDFYSLWGLWSEMSDDEKVAFIQWWEKR